MELYLRMGFLSSAQVSIKSVRILLTTLGDDIQSFIQQVDAWVV